MLAEPNTDSIKPVSAGLSRKALDVESGCAAQATALGGIDLLKTRTPGSGPGRLDLYEDQQVPLAAHEIKLRSSDPDIASQDLQALASQVAGGCSFAQAAQGGTVDPAGTAEQPT